MSSTAEFINNNVNFTEFNNLFKTLHEETVQAICREYKLDFQDVMRKIGDHPQFNLNEGFDLNFKKGKKNTNKHVKSTAKEAKKAEKAAAKEAKEAEMASYKWLSTMFIEAEKQAKEAEKATANKEKDAKKCFKIFDKKYQKLQKELLKKYPAYEKNKNKIAKEAEKAKKAAAKKEKDAEKAEKVAYKWLSIIFEQSEKATTNAVVTNKSNDASVNIMSKL